MSSRCAISASSDAAFVWLRLSVTTLFSSEVSFKIDKVAVLTTKLPVVRRVLNIFIEVSF